jgi:hypothetical protein
MGSSHKGKYPALAKIIEAAHQIDTRHEDGALALKAILMAVAEARISARPKVLDTAPLKASTALLLYCPTRRVAGKRASGTEKRTVGFQP